MPISSGLPICTGAPCTAGKARGDLDGADGIGRLHRPHRDDHGSVERARRRGRDRGAVHRHGGVAGDVAQLDAVLDQRLLERERAAQHEGDEIVAPMGADVGRLVDQLAVAGTPGSAAGRCGCRGPSASVGSRKSPGAEAASSGQGFGLSWQKRRKSPARSRRQNREIALHVAGRHAGGRTLERAGAERRAARRGRSAECPSRAIVATVMALPRRCVEPADAARCDHLIIGKRGENRLNMGAGSRLLRIMSKQEPGNRAGRSQNREEYANG